MKSINTEVDGNEGNYYRLGVDGKKKGEITS